MKNYFIIHGTNGNAYENWFPWLYSKFAEAGECCLVPHFPGEKLQCYSTWKKNLESYLKSGVINSDTIFITHSLGSVFVTRFLVEKRVSVAGVISVSGFNSLTLVPEFNELNELNKTFLTKDKLLARVKNYVKFYHCIYSLNDPYLAIENLMAFAKTVDAKIHEIQDGGHFNINAGYKEFPFLWELLDKINTIV